MLTYHFNHELGIPMYEYLYQCIKNDIIQQKLQANEKLPSKRVFAKHLQVSLITIENAYNQLLIEGYIYSIEKKGYFVNSIEYPEIPTQTVPTILEKPQIQYFIDLRTNSISLSNFPFSVWSKLTRQVLNSQNSELLIRAHQQGCLELREAICEHLHAFSGMNVSPSQIVIGAGTEYLYNIVIQLLGRDQHYALENPGHRSIAKVYQLNNVHYQYISLDHDGLNIDELKKSQAQIVHISPAHHYPTGISMPIQRRLEILKWATQQHTYIIEDDYDSELRLGGKPIPTLQSIDVSDKVIYMNTFTKTLSSTIRMSYMVLPESLADEYYKRLSFYSCTVSNFEQYTLSRFIENGHFERHINRLRNYYLKKQNTILNAFQTSSLNNKIEIYNETTGVHFLMKIKSEKAEKDIINNAFSKGIKLSPLSQYYKNNDENKNIYVMNYSSLDSEKIELIVEKLKQCI